MTNSELTIDGEVVRKRYLRIDRGQPKREWAALVHLHEHAPGLGARPIARDSEPPVVVMSRVEGAPFDEVLTLVQTRAMVAAYRSLYAVPVPTDMPLRVGDPAAFIAENGYWLAHERRDDLPKVMIQALDSAARWYADAPLGIEDICDLVVIQGDGNAMNMLWDGDRVSLVDFEHAGVGDLAFEVADLVEHASSRLRSLFDPEEVIGGFSLTAAQLVRVDAYRIVLAAFWLLELLPGNPGHERNPPGSTERQAEYLLTRIARFNIGT